MKIRIYILILIPLLISCTQNKSLQTSDLKFPLNQTFVLPVEHRINQVTSTSNYVFVRTQNSIMAVDVNAQKVLWEIDMRASLSDEGFQAINDRLIVATRDDIFIIDKLGQQSKINLQIYDTPTTIIEILKVSPEYLYVVRGDWTLEAYDISKNTMLWKIYVGRGVGEAHYDSLKDIVYLVTDDYVKAIENSTGTLIWEVLGSFRGSVLDNAVLYLAEDGNEQTYRIVALDILTRTRLWEKNIAVLPDVSIGRLRIIDNFLIACGEIGIIAVDKTTGELIWKNDLSDEISIPPISFDGILYAKGINTHSVYAISLDKGVVVGHLQLEDANLFDSLNVLEGVYLVNDGIVFNTDNSIAVYKK